MLELEYAERGESVTREAHDRALNEVEHLRKKIGKWEKGLGHPGAVQVIRGEMRREAKA